MYKQSITFQPYTIADADKITVYSKLRARHAATGLQYFSSLRTSTTLAINGTSDGIGEDLLHSATVGRLEADAYARDVAYNLPLTLEAFGVLLEDFGNFSAIERTFQFSEVQAAIDSDLRGGATGRAYTPKPHTSTEATTVTAEMIKPHEALEEAMLSILKKKSLVKMLVLYSEGTPEAEIAEIIGSTVDGVECALRRAKKKLQTAGLQAFLK